MACWVTNTVPLHHAMHSPTCITDDEVDGNVEVGRANTRSMHLLLFNIAHPPKMKKREACATENDVNDNVEMGLMAPTPCTYVP